MAFVKDILVEEYIRLSEKLEFYLIKNQDAYIKTIVEIKKDMDFIEKAFAANNINLAQEVVLMQRNECEQVRKKHKFAKIRNSRKLRTSIKGIARRNEKGLPGFEFHARLQRCHGALFAS